MMMVDLSSFADNSFDPKAWVNAACKARHPDDPIDKHLNDLEMKLQLISENVASSLEEQSMASLLKVPRASRDVIRVRDDASSLRSTVSAILLKLKKAEGSCAESVAALARVDAVKQRMEAAHGTLQDAAGLAQLSASVEDVFASGDLPRAAETLANMRRCLAVIWEVPEFANVKRQLEVLEDRLEAMVQPQLSDALSQRKVEATQSLRDILVTIGHNESLEQQYTRVRLKSLRQVWEEYDSGKGGLAVGKSSVDEKQGERRAATLILTSSGSPTSFDDWLPQFYDEVLLSLEQEWKWCSLAFPEEYKSLVPKLLVELMSLISTTFAMRIESSSLEIVSRAGSVSLDDGLFGANRKGEQGHYTQLGLLIMLHNMSSTFARNVQRLFGSIEVEDMMKALRAIFSPYEGYKERYGELELSLLTAEVSSLDLRGAVSRGVGARGVEVSETVGRMEGSIPAVAVLLEAAVERCITFTGGSEVEALLQTLDEVMRLYLGVLQDMLRSLRFLCGVDRAVQDLSSSSIGLNKKESGIDGLMNTKEVNVLNMVPDEEEWAIVQGALQVLTVADSLSSRSAVFEASLRATLLRLANNLCLPKLISSVGEAVVFNNKRILSSEMIAGGPLVFDVAVLRLIDVPDKARRLSSLLEQAKDTGFHALAHSSARVASFIEAVNELVYDVLIAKVRSRLSGVAQMNVWGAEEEENAFDLPSFSAYASSYITSIGEYLLTLPQQLEPVMMGGGAGGLSTDSSDENAEAAQLFATEWMFKVAEGATSLYVEQLRGIQFLSDRGAQQLTADIDYLCKVLSALSMEVPSNLATFQACLSTPKDRLPEMIKSDLGVHQDILTARLICKMRRISID